MRVLLVVLMLVVYLMLVVLTVGVGLVLRAQLHGPLVRVLRAGRLLVLLAAVRAGGLVGEAIEGV